MQRPTSPMKIIWLLVLGVLFFLSALLPANAATAVSLLKMDKQENPYHTRIQLNTSTVPEFSMTSSGQRVDVTLKDAKVGKTLHELPEDETVVKIMLAQKHRDLMVSILLRRPPKQVVAESRDNPPGVVLDLYWEESDVARPAVAFRIAGMPPRKAGAKAAAHQQRSPWEEDWMQFFSAYRSDWHFKLPLSYTLPPLAPLVTDRQNPVWALQTLADEGRFLSLLDASEGLNDLSEAQTYQRDQLVAEAQLRSGALAAGLARLERLRNRYGSDNLRVEYLTAYAQAGQGQPVVGQLTLAAVVPKAGGNRAMLPLLQLLNAEMALAAGRDKEALPHLDAVAFWPDRLQDIAGLRRADALAGTGDLGKAVALYRELAEVGGLFEHYLFSCSRAASSAFRHGDYEFATTLYRRLIELTDGLPGHDLVLFGAGVSAYESGDLTWGMIGLERAALDSPGSEGSDRARLRLIDHQVVSGGELELAKAAGEYGRLARASRYRAVREEGYFKQALAHYLLEDYRASVDELMTFRRDFFSSALRHDAELLLTRQIPRVVRQLMEQQNDLEAVVLVEKNRSLLLGNRLDRDFLEDLAGAFGRLGLYDRAARVLLYLFDRIEDPDQKEHLYLPLARSYFKRGEYRQVSDYASRYLETYPEGGDAGALLDLLLDALKEQGRDDELLQWLKKSERPSSAELETRAAWDFWRLGDLDGVVAALEKVLNTETGLQVKEMALLAEAAFQTGRSETAEACYRQLLEDPEYGPQAHYRTAQLLLKRHRKNQAAALLRKLVDENDESLWAKLARDLLTQVKR